MSHGYVTSGYVKPGYVRGTGKATTAAVSTQAPRFRTSTIQAQVFLTIGPPQKEVEYEFSNGRTFTTSP